MVIPGRVQNGIVVPLATTSLPEGADVRISYPAQSELKPVVEKRRIQVPLVQTGQPGRVSLRGARIAEILDAEEDVSHVS